jgi:hypothetical protein
MHRPASRRRVSAVIVEDGLTAVDPQVRLVRIAAIKTPKSNSALRPTY